MSEFLEATVDKFTFRVATDRLYTDTHLWVKEEAGLVKIGLTDYLQQSSGDVAFAEPRPAGTSLNSGDELAVVETMKTNLGIPVPVNGTIAEVNARLEDEPELVNQDPYGDGWLVEVTPANWPADQAGLLTPQAYYDLMKAEAEAEAKKL